MNKSNVTLRKAHKLLRKIVKKMNRPDLHFSAQIGIDASKDGNFNTYAAMIAAPREGLAPITFAAFTPEDFLQKLKDFYEGKISEEQVEVAYHNAQIVSNERSIEHHREQIDKIQNPVQEEPEAKIPTVQEETTED